MRAPRSLTFPISPTSLSKYHHPIKKRKDREKKKKKKKISLPILSVSISFEASKDICLLGKKGTRKEKKRKGEEDKRTHARRRLRLIYDCFEKNFEKKDRENRVRGGEGEEKGGGGGEEKNCTPDDGETSYNYGYCVLRFYSRLFLSSVELVGTASVSWSSTWFVRL